MRTGCLVLGVMALAMPSFAASPEFTPRDILAWRSESFQGETAYDMDGEALRARCLDSASGLFLRQEIDLRVTPVIEWSWRVDAVFDSSVDEKTKPGDDFPARLYVVRDGGVIVWRTRAINYVWASAMPPGSSWPNPFASQAHMVALRSGGPSAPGQWVTERRNIRDDFRRYHGRDIETIDAVAIMTDCDNRGRCNLTSGNLVGVRVSRAHPRGTPRGWAIRQSGCSDWREGRPDVAEPGYDRHRSHGTAHRRRPGRDGAGVHGAV